MTVFINHHLGNPHLDNGTGAVGAWEVGHVHNTAAESHTDAGGIINGIAFGVFCPVIFYGACVTLFQFIVDIAWKPVVTVGAGGAISPDDDGTNTCGTILRPFGDLMG